MANCRFLTLCTAIQLASLGGWMSDLSAQESANAPASTDSALVDKELSAIRHYSRYGPREALSKVERLVNQAAGTNDALRGTMVPRLVGLLSEPVTPDCRGFVCEQLGLLGAEESIDAIVPWTLESSTAVQALGALERIGGAKAKNAIQQSLAKADPAQSMPLMLSAGRMNDGTAVPEIAKRLAGAPEVALAAIQALGDIDAPEAFDALLSLKNVAEPLRNAYSAALLARVAAAGDGLASQKQAALTVLTETSTPIAIRRVAFAQEMTTPDSIRKALASADLVRIQAALEALSRDSGFDRGGLLAEALPTLPVSTQAQALSLLGEIVNPASPESISVIAALGKSPDLTARHQAYQVLGKIGTPAAAEALFMLVTEAPAGDMTAIGEGLTSLPDKVSLPLIRDRLATAPPPVAELLIKQLVSSNDQSAAPLLLRQLNTAKDPAANTIINALGEIGGADTLVSLGGLMSSPSLPADRLRISMIRIAQRNPANAFPQLMALWEKSTPETRVKWLAVFGVVPTPESLAHLKRAATDESPDLRLEALRTLGTWPDASPVDLLLNIAEGNSDLKTKALALRSAVTLLQKANNLKPEKLVVTLKRGLTISTRPEEKRLFIAVAAKNTSPEIIRFLQAENDTDVRDEVARLLSAQKLPITETNPKN